jgi:cholesterol transport system auxiliary component
MACARWAIGASATPSVLVDVRANAHWARPLARCALLVLMGLLSLSLPGCGGTPTIQRYDFAAPGAVTGSGSQPLAIRVDVTAPAWLDGPAVLYRLDYADGSQVHAYALSQWVAPPARLLEQALRQGPYPAPCAAERGPGSVVSEATLAVDLQEFGQAFSTPESSAAVLRARVRVLAAHGGAILDQRDFDLRGAASPPDATGAVHGLRDLSLSFAAAVHAWAAPVICAPAAVAGASH